MKDFKFKFDKFMDDICKREDLQKQKTTKITELPEDKTRPDYSKLFRHSVKRRYGWKNEK